MNSFFICDPDRIQDKLREFENDGVSSDGWVHYYKDAQNERWRLSTYYYDKEEQVEILQKLPGPNTAQLIEIALTARGLPDIRGASMELLAREEYNDEPFREQLLDGLYTLDLDDLSMFDRQRVQYVIYDSELFDGHNRKDTLGKHHQQVSAEAEFYRTCARKALAILIKLEMLP